MLPNKSDDLSEGILKGLRHYERSSLSDSFMECTA